MPLEKFGITIAALALYGTLDERRKLRKQARDLFHAKHPGERWKGLTPKQRFDYLVKAELDKPVPAPDSIDACVKRLKKLETLGPGATMGVPSWVILEICEQEGMRMDEVQRSLTTLSGAISEWNYDCTHLVFTLYGTHK